jgi:hypothetical protein
MFAAMEAMHSHGEQAARMAWIARGGNQRRKIVVGIDLAAPTKVVGDLIHFLVVENVVAEAGKLLPQPVEEREKHHVPALDFVPSLISPGVVAIMQARRLFKDFQGRRRARLSAR